MRYDFDQPLDRRDSDSTKWRVYGPDVLPLWTADMDFRVPEPVIEALHARVDHGVFGYCYEPPELREVIVERLARLYAWRVPPEAIVFGTGVVSAFHRVCRVTASAGDGILVQPPVYQPILGAPAHNGSAHQEAPLVAAADGRWEIDFDAFEAAVTDRTRVFILCNPHNPVGRVFRRDELEHLAAICLRRGILICSDEIHCDLVFPGHAHTPIASLDPGIERRCVTLMAPSKTFNVPGLRCSFAIVTDPAAGYSLTDGSALYWEMGSRLWQIENGSLTEIENPLREVDYTLRTGSNNGVTEQTAWQGKVQLDGQKYYVVKVTLNGRSAALVQLLPANTFLLHYGVYLWLVALGTAIIWGLSFLMQHWLERVITRPVEALQKRIETVGSGNFAPDRTVEWNNELGDIGRGINQLAENVDSLMTRRVEDERRKQELEYRMLQNEVNPHFIYNTLNSIRWMATIQHAPGIAEMVTAFARLTKSISKGTQKLVPLQEELALLNDYFTIQQYRYGGDLEIEVSRIESETLCRDCMIPRFTLQPLVENAIFHGLEPKGGHGSVLLDISTDPDTGDVLLRITDDGVGMPPEQVAHLLDEPAEGAEKAEKFRHVGLWNVNRRIRYSFGEGYGLTIESEEDVGTEVTIRLPYQQKGDTHAADITGG